MGKGPATTAWKGQPGPGSVGPMPRRPPAHVREAGGPGAELTGCPVCVRPAGSHRGFFLPPGLWQTLLSGPRGQAQLAGHCQGSTGWPIAGSRVGRGTTMTECLGSCEPSNLQPGHSLQSIWKVSTDFAAISGPAWPGRPRPPSSPRALTDPAVAHSGNWPAPSKKCSQLPWDWPEQSTQTGPAGSVWN